MSENISQPERSAAESHEEREREHFERMRRSRSVQRENQEARDRFVREKNSITDTWQRLLRARDNARADDNLRRAALNLLEDAELARRAEIEQAAERERAEAESRASEERLRALAENLPGGAAFIIDRDWRYRLATGEALVAAGLRPEDFIGRTVMEAVGTELSALYQPHFRKAFAGETFTHEHASHGRIYLSRGVPLRGPDGKVESILALSYDITERKCAEEAVRASEARLRTLADSLPQIIWSNTAEGVANYFNRRWYEYSGLSYQESVGLGWQAIVHPEDEPASTDRWLKALAAGEIFDCEYRLRDAGGNYRWFIGRNVPERDAAGNVTGWFGTATDIQDLKEAEATVRETQERMRLIVENAREYAIFSMDLDRRITSWNTGAQAILGYTREKAIGQSADMIFVEEDRAAGVPELEAVTALKEGRASDERWHLRKDGSRFWGSGVMTTMRDPNGRVFGLVKIFRDHTAELLAKEEMERHREELWEALQETERAREEAESAGKAKDHFLAVLSHELRTPLTPSLMICDMLLSEEELSPLARDGLETILRNVQLEAHFIDDLLDITRISRGKLKLASDPLDLHDTIRRAVEIAQPDVQAKGQTLTLELNAAKSAVRGDFPRLQQLFWNLLKNAAKFTPNGGALRVVTRNEPEHIVVEVSDTGCGIEPNALPNIFEAFRQGGTSITRRFGGLGLGLAISKATVDALGGTIAASSPGADQGTTFSVRIPLRAD